MKIQIYEWVSIEPSPKSFQIAGRVVPDPIGSPNLMPAEIAAREQRRVMSRSSPPSGASLILVAIGDTDNLSNASLFCFVFECSDFLPAVPPHGFRSVKSMFP